MDKFLKNGLFFLIGLAVLVGLQLAYQRWQIENQRQALTLCADLRDLKKLAAIANLPLPVVLKQVKAVGISAIGVFEETLPEAAYAGELYYARGAGLKYMSRSIPAFIPFVNYGVIKPDYTYIYAPAPIIKQRVYRHLELALGLEKVKNLTENMLEVTLPPEELVGIGLGIAPAPRKFLNKLGFTVIPRVWNDITYNDGNLASKVAAFHGFKALIFDGEEILGYPDNLAVLAKAMQYHHLKYGFIEIVKQDGDKQLLRLMGKEILRVHSVPKDELKKITPEEAVVRFVRAARERQINLFYLRVFLPPQIKEDAFVYNLHYFQQITNHLQSAGFTVDGLSNTATVNVPTIQLQRWQLFVLGTGVFAAGLCLLGYYGIFPAMAVFIVVLLGFLFILFSFVIPIIYFQKILAWLCVVIFPALSVLAVFTRITAPDQAVRWWFSLLVLAGKVMLLTVAGIFILIGLLADSRFLLGAQTFAGVKFALLLPPLLVIFYVLFREGKETLWQKIQALLEIKISVKIVLAAIFALVALLVLLARSGNFVLPVPAFEKYLRLILEQLLYIRPRTKEFLIGYPFLFLAAFYFTRKKSWAWWLLVIGTIAPVSVMNSFCHAHSPLLVSFLRSFNGLVLGTAIGLLAVYLCRRFIKT